MSGAGVGWRLSFLVDRLVDADGSAALVAADLPAGPLVFRLGDGVLVLASSQVAALVEGRERLIAAEVAGRVRG
jgi:hypothetical protein